MSLADSVKVSVEFCIADLVAFDILDLHGTMNSEIHLLGLCLEVGIFGLKRCCCWIYRLTLGFQCIYVGVDE